MILFNKPPYVHGLYMFLLSLMVNWGWLFNYFTTLYKVFNINPIEVFSWCFSMQMTNILKGTVFRHQQTSAESILEDFYVLVQIILSYAYVKVDWCTF